jgi:hypothetical protein
VNELIATPAAIKTKRINNQVGNYCVTAVPEQGTAFFLWFLAILGGIKTGANG